MVKCKTYSNSFDFARGINPRARPMEELRFLHLGNPSLPLSPRLAAKSQVI